MFKPPYPRESLITLAWLSYLEKVGEGYGEGAPKSKKDLKKSIFFCESI